MTYGHVGEGVPIRRTMYSATSRTKLESRGHCGPPPIGRAWLMLPCRPLRARLLSSAIYARKRRRHADRRLANIQALGQFTNTLAVRATEHDPRPLRQPLSNGPGAQPTPPAPNDPLCSLPPSMPLPPCRLEAETINSETRG
jgi:hypothetical protein